MWARRQSACLTACSHLYWWITGTTPSSPRVTPSASPLSTSAGAMMVGYSNIIVIAIMIKQFQVPKFIIILIQFNHWKNLHTYYNGLCMLHLNCRSSETTNQPTLPGISVTVMWMCERLKTRVESFGWIFCSIGMDR